MHLIFEAPLFLFSKSIEWQLRVRLKHFHQVTVFHLVQHIGGHMNSKSFRDLFSLEDRYGFRENYAHFYYLNRGDIVTVTLPVSTSSW